MIEIVSSTFFIVSMCDTATLLLQNDWFNVNTKLIFLSRRLWLEFVGIDDTVFVFLTWCHVI